MNRTHAAFLLPLLLSCPAIAQFPIGHPTPIAGYSPELFAEPMWLGNPIFGFRLENGPPGGLALVFLSLSRYDQNVLGVQLYPSLGPDVVLVEAGAIDASGNWVVGIPLPGPENPAFAGLDFYAQAAVITPTAPGVLGATQGLLLDVALHLMLAIGHTGGMVLVDPILGATTPVVGLPTGSGAGPAVFANGGRDLFVVTGGGVSVIDTLAPTPTAVSLLSGSFTSVAWDRVHQRLYATYPYLARIHVVDGDRSSPGFGVSVAQVSRYATSLAIDAEGARLALGSAFGAFELLDVRPSSATYLQTIPTAPSPITFGYGTVVGPAHISPDGRVVSIPVNETLAPGSTSLHRLDVASNQWIDHDPSAPGVQPMTSLAHPQLSNLFGFLPASNGGQAFLCGQTWVIAIDFALGSTALTLAATPLSQPIPFLNQYLAVSPSGRFLLRREAVSGGVELALVDVANGTSLPLVALPIPSWSIGSAVWR